MNRSQLAVLLLAVLAGANLSCVTQEERKEGLKEAPAPHIEKLAPPMTVVGKGFQVQPSGESALSVVGSNFVRQSRVFLNGKPAATGFGGAATVSAIVPAELYSREGDIQVTVENPDGRVSNAVTFRVFPVSGPAPLLARLFPGSCVVGRGFNVQPNGESAMGVVGSKFLPGARIFFGKSPLDTAFGGASSLSAIVPAALLRTPRTVKVYVENPDGKTSNLLDFPITAGPK